MVDISRINVEDPNTLKQVIDRLTALEKQVKAIPDSLPPEKGVAQVSRQGYMSKEQVVALNNATTALATVTTGLAKIGKGCRVYMSGTMNFTSGTPTAFGFGLERWDDANFHDPSVNSNRITIPVGWGGRYNVGCAVTWGGGGSGARIVQLRLNGATVIDQMTLDGQTSSGPSFPPFETPWPLVAGDYVEVIGNQTAPGATRTGQAEFWVTKLDYS